MPQVDSDVFHATVYEIVRMIPHGMVTTYGHIARLAGSPAHSRLVGQALKFLQAPDVPWQRVIGAGGTISDRGDGGEGAARQAERLREEGVNVSESGAPLRFRVNIQQYGWFPNQVSLYDSEEEAEDGE
ncbi:DNA binding methylated-DNA--cysteine S-methyltransferase [Meira miltonrushii]|uniref:DNA binding methylated-DNA--cysteine S-methyltransferase n=1 Tax=Meira miltonrushii TaxID=1280837 RepID=A0A316VML7_9BASI|nr:DNA binding methylated-DNA--cysteine S-methyltransferase [Meira miltonrushii]PWN37341.1 DNA binding methylated-DNA--cysteine S-methyltransferase [Meira miltonrushii]